MSKLTNEEFWGKADYEGGLTELAGYGLTPSDIKDQQLAKLWKEYRQVYSKLEKLSDKIHDYLRENGVENV